MQYNPAYVEFRPILSIGERQRLVQLDSRYPLSRFRRDTRNYEEMVVDFVYTSGKIEGNTYDRLDTNNLLRLGVTAGGKRYSDAIMLVNLRNAFEIVLQIEQTTDFDLNYLGNLHKVLIGDSLPLHEQGLGRRSSVNIGASPYVPLTDPVRLRTEAEFVLAEATKYQDPFEQAIYLHCNLAYLQYFRDGNKRTARLMQTAALVKGGRLPLFFSDVLIDKYVSATVKYDETGEYAPYVAFFLENYEQSLSSLVGAPTPNAQHLSPIEVQERNRRIHAIANIPSAGGVAKVFWEVANRALQAYDDPEDINWAELERQTIVQCIAQEGLLEDDVLQALFLYSPCAVTEQWRHLLSADMRRLAPVLRQQYLKSQSL